MTRNGNDTAVSEVIGVVLMIGLAVLLIAVLQVAAVPVWNEEVEIDHSRDVQDDMTGFKDAVQMTAGGGNPYSASIKLGTDYPNRIVLRSPPASTGRVSTTPMSNLTVSNVTATGNAATYWESTDGNLTTRSVVYTPDYNEYQGAPDTVYENSVVYNRFADGNGTIAGQNVVDGDRINLVTVNGRLSQESSGRFSVETKPVSAPSNTVSVTNTSAGNLTVELPGDLPVQKWRELLEDEMVENGGYVVKVGDTTRGVVIEMKGDESYEMRAAKVGVGGNAEDTEAEYIVKQAGDQTVPQGTVIELVVEVRDGYNNPVGGATVNAEVLTGGRFQNGGSTEDGTTDENGRARFAYEVANGDNEVRASINGDSTAYENVTFEPKGWRSTGSGGGGGAYDTFWITDDKTGSDAHDVQQDGQTVELTMGTSPIADGARVEYSVNDTGIGEVSPNRDSTNADGRNTTTLTVKENGSIKIYTSSGGSGDDLNVTVENFPSQAVVYNGDAAAFDINDGGGGPAEAVNFSITNEGSSTVTMTDMVIESPAATRLIEDSSSYPWDSEVRVDSNDVGRANEGSAYILGNSIAAYEDEGTFENDLAAGETATVYMHRFRDSGGDQVDMDGKQVTVTFEFQSGESETFTFTPQRPPTEFTSLDVTVNQDGGGNSPINNIEFSGDVNNPDGNGEVVARLIDPDTGDEIDSDSADMTGSFSIDPLDADGNRDVNVVVELVDGDGNAYQTCNAGVSNDDTTLSLSDFSCT